MDKRGLTERDICTKFILPAIVRAGWDSLTSISCSSLSRTMRSF